MSIENPFWGAPRIHGELLKPGFEVAQSSVAKYMVKTRANLKTSLAVSPIYNSRTALSRRRWRPRRRTVRASLRQMPDPPDHGSGRHPHGPSEASSEMNAAAAAIRKTGKGVRNLGRDGILRW
jgi:hypothetical protein